MQAHYTYAQLLRDTGRFNQAEDFYRNALKYEPQHQSALSNLIYMQASQERLSPEGMVKVHQDWAARFVPKDADKTYDWPRAEDNLAQRDRPLKISYVSRDFYRHVVGGLIEPIIRNHDRTNVEITCYAQLSKADAMSERFKQYADHWRAISGQSDKDVADQIRKDGIDILIDLSGHTLGIVIFDRTPERL